MKWSQCKHCKKWMPRKAIGYHENVACLVMRGLKPAPTEEPDEDFTALPGESINDMLERIIQARKNTKP